MIDLQSTPTALERGQMKKPVLSITTLTVWFLMMGLIRFFFLVQVCVSNKARGSSRLQGKQGITVQHVFTQRLCAEG